MKDQTWKMATWSDDWRGVGSDERSTLGSCSYSDVGGLILEIPYGRVSAENTLEVEGGLTLQTSGYSTPFRLVGMTQDGFRIALRGVKSKGVSSATPGDDRETLIADTAFVGKCIFDDHKPIVAAELEIRGLQRWLDFTVRANAVNGNYTVKDEAVKNLMPLYKSEDLSVKIQHGTTRPRVWKDAFDYHLFANVRIDCTQGITLDGLWHDVVWRVQSLLAFFLGSYPSIESMCVWFDDGVGPVSVYRQSYVGKDVRIVPDSVPVSYQSLGSDGLLAVGTKWFEMKGDERRAAEILTTLLGGWTMPFELPMISLSAMMDSLGRANEVKPYSRTELDELRERIVQATPEDIRTRVWGILGQLNSHSYADRLDAVYKECDAFGSWLIEDWKRFKKEQGDIRSNGAHGGESGCGIEVVVDHYYALMLLAYRVLLSRLGAPESAIEHFIRSSFLKGQRMAIREHYALSSNEMV